MTLLLKFKTKCQKDVNLIDIQKNEDMVWIANKISINRGPKNEDVNNMTTHSCINIKKWKKSQCNI